MIIYMTTWAPVCHLSMRVLQFSESQEYVLDKPLPKHSNSDVCTMNSHV